MGTIQRVHGVTPLFNLQATLPQTTAIVKTHKVLGIRKSYSLLLKTSCTEPLLLPTIVLTPIRWCATGIDGHAVTPGFRNMYT